MNDSNPHPTDQRAGIRPIAFVLEIGGTPSIPAQLSIRPEDLTRNEPTRATVHQTLGREISGWVDHFGTGLPSVTIAGHTGWRYAPGNYKDGAQAFEDLNQMVVHDYNAAKQYSIDHGDDPAGVKLLFVDTLDNFAWSIIPTQFILRRSKSRPLLYQYNMTLQAIATNIDVQPIQTPKLGNASNGLFALKRSIVVLTAAQAGVGGWVSAAVKQETGFLVSIAARVAAFTSFATGMFTAVSGIIAGAKGVITGIVNDVIGIAKDLANVGIRIFRVVNQIAGIGDFLKASLLAVATAFNEVLCIFSNSLRSKKTYEQYTGLYGASTCSSTTGGSMPSPFADVNAFLAMYPQPSPITLGPKTLSSIKVLLNMDPILSPLPLSEIGRHAGNIAGLV